MSGRQLLGQNVFDAAVGRLVVHYAAGHRLVVSLSGGKDSACVLECAVLAAKETGRLPVEAVTRDEEIMYPGTYEYLERVHDRPEVDLLWLVAHQPIVNCFDRANPYWWVMDPLLPSEQWVRTPPDFATEIPELHIEAIVTPQRYPPAPGKTLFSVQGLRTSESPGRLRGLHMMGGYLTQPRHNGVRNMWPIYDWGDGDVWLAIRRNGWDYNTAYDVMTRYGFKGRGLRISPPTMNAGGGALLQQMGSKAWPGWWDRVCRRLPTVRTFAQYGMRAVMAERRYGESWKQTFYRTCVEEAPAWIAERAIAQRDILLRLHGNHSTNEDLPEVKGCWVCGQDTASWRNLTKHAYLGDPFSMKMKHLPFVEPERFRPGAGLWGGTPSH
jgi:predicted phosphoadenosine phosphosulfate sulfurtransferase